MKTNKTLLNQSQNDLLKVIFFLFIASFCTSCDYIFHQKSEAEIKQELSLKEKDNSPTNYLSVVDSLTQFNLEYDMVKVEDNFWSDDKYEKRIKGYYILVAVTNIATLTKFKDITLEIVYTSSTKSEMERQQTIIYDYLEPGTYKTFRINVIPPADWYSQSDSHYSIRVKSAQPVY